MPETLELLFYAGGSQAGSERSRRDRSWLLLIESGSTGKQSSGSLPEFEMVSIRQLAVEDPAPFHHKSIPIRYEFHETEKRKRGSNKGKPGGIEDEGQGLRHERVEEDVAGK